MKYIKNKIKKLIFGSSIFTIIIVIIILIPCLMLMDFFGANVVDGYVENNSEYADEYKKILNQNIKTGNGYVSLERILYFYLSNDSLSFQEIYNDNLDIELKKQKPISEVCILDKYKYLSVCNSPEIDNSSQINEEQKKPFNFPLAISNMNVTSFFMEQRIVFGKYDVHSAWDLSSPNNTPIYSVCDGIITKVNFKYSENKTDLNGGGGNQITLECNVDDISYIVLYAHLFPNSSKVKEGDSVSAFQQIGEVGTTGYSTGPHLHFEVSLNNRKIDGISLIDFTNVNSIPPIYGGYDSINKLSSLNN